MSDPDPTDQSTNPSLVRGLGILDATMIVMGSMIGSGIFLVSADVARLVGSPGWLLVIWGVSGLMTVAGALCAAEVAAMLPKAGGQYVFLREAYGSWLGFVFGWATFLVVQTGTIAAVAVAFAKFLGVFAPGVAADNWIVSPVLLGSSGYAFSLTTQQLIALLVILVLTISNTRGLKTGTLIQNTFTVSKTTALFALIVIGFLMGNRPESALKGVDFWSSSANGWTPEAALPGPLGGLGYLTIFLIASKAMIGPLFSQTAWNSVTFTGGEIKDPGKTLPRSLFLGCTSVVILYLLANYAYLTTLPWDSIKNAPQDRVATAMMTALLGGPGTYVMAGAILISTFGCVNGLILSGARVYYAMAKDGLFFKAIGTTNRHHVPSVALVAQGIWAAFLVLPVTVGLDTAGKVTYGNLYGQLLDYIAPVDLTFYALMVGAVIVLRRKQPNTDRPYRTIGYPITPLFYVVMAALLVVGFLVTGPGTSGIGFAIALTGLPVYALWAKSSKSTATSLRDRS